MLTRSARFDGSVKSNTTYTYDALGNIESKLHLGDYVYDSTMAGPMPSPLPMA